MPTRLVVCCDGTWNTPDQKVDGAARPTNVTKLALSVADRDSTGMRQCAYYHPGVGVGRWDHLRGGAFGAGLSANVLDAYRFLVNNYEDGDELWFFGFSRGAYTARSVAGLVRNCGILRPENLDRLDEAYALYRARSESPRGTASTLFRRAYSYEPAIRFIGVWDTVGELGIPVPRTPLLRWAARRINRRWAFHDTDLSSHVAGAFQALSIDEKRSVFAPTLWSQQEGVVGQAMEQVWFAGVHCDVGGGYAESGLSDVTLLWMMNKARSFGLELTQPPSGAVTSEGVSPTRSAEFTANPDPLGPLHESRKGIYRLAKPYYRPIGVKPGGNESISAAATERHDAASAHYDPENLAAYLAHHS